ncbi:MAG: electron transport complex subunit RsxB [Gammaproteobacteria bacterium]
MIATVLALGAIGAAAGVVLGFLASRFKEERSSLAKAIDARLPQTQCAQCGYPGCRPYADAIAQGEASIDQCPPGGDRLVRELAELLGAPASSVNPEFGETKPPQIAFIDESHCIGCALCLPACPVDAILGAHRFTHTVLVNQCTGCELCLPPCPVDCIDLVSR